MNQPPLFSEHWHHVKNLQPRLAGDVTITQHIYRKVPSYVLHRQSTGAYHRLDARVFQSIAVLDGSISIDEAWKQSIETQGDIAPTQSELMGLLAQLHEAELLTVNRKLDAEQLFDRAQNSTRNETKQRFLNPLFLRFSLFDPDQLLNSLQPFARFLFSRTAFITWVALVALALVVLLPNWSSLRYEIASTDVLSAGNFVLFLLIYPVLKLAHELAHGLAVKKFGGEVHELGMALMVFLPIPYVDASAATAMPDKRHRILVSAAGILVELAFAAIATLVWSVSGGMLHDVALIAMIIGGVSTVLFNGNPLLKFDGYYVLADTLEIPNLADRSRQYLLAAARQRFFGMPHQNFQLADRAEGIWLALYGVLSSTYKLIIMSAIALMLSDKFFFFGIALALWVVATMIGLPLYRLLRFVASAPQLSRPRAVFVTTGLAASVLMIIAFLPLPLSTTSRGVVWLPENSVVRVPSLCEVTQVLVAPGAMVMPGESLFYCEDHQLDSELRIQQAKLDRLKAVRNGLELTDRVGHEKFGHEIETLQAIIEHTDGKLNRQLVTAQSTGRFFAASGTTLEGQYLAPGDLAAYVVPDHTRTVRVAIEQADATWFQQGNTNAELQFYEQAGKRQIFSTSVQRQTPQSTSVVPSAGLTTAGGGKIVADPSGDGRTVLEPVFDVELAWPNNAPAVNVGSHVSVVFRHSPTTLLDRFLVKAQRALLGRLEA